MQMPGAASTQNATKRKIAFDPSGFFKSAYERKGLLWDQRLNLIRMLAPTPLGRLRNLWIGLSCVHVSTQKFVDTSILVHLREFKVTLADA